MNEINITSGKILRAQKVVIYGVEGIGKSTFASQFPNPLFIDTEDSTLHMNVQRFDKPTSWNMLLQQVDYVKINKPCKTLIIDTIDWAEKLCKEYLISLNKWTDSSNDYGAKYIALEKEFGNLLNKLSDMPEIGINVIITAHAKLNKKEEPDEMGAYDRYELKLEKKTAPLVKEWADAVLFANYKTTILTDEKTKSKKGVGGQRMMFTTHRPAWDAKNRWELADELPFDYSQIAQVFASVTPQPKANENVIREAAEEIEKSKQQAVSQSEPNFAPERNEINSAIPGSVADLMKMNQVSSDEILQVIYQGGFMPQDTPIENIPADLWGYLASNWSSVLNLLNTKIRKF